MSEAMIAGTFAGILAAYIFVPILNERQPRWYMAMGEFGIRLLTPPIIALTRLLTWILEKCK